MRKSASASAPPSRLLGVTIASAQSFSSVVERSRSSPSTFAPTAAFARPAPMSAATFAAVTGVS